MNPLAILHLPLLREDMTHELFRKLVTDNTPRMNELTMSGLAVHKVRGIEHYVDNVLKSAAKSFPQGLEYAGYEKCSPQEEFHECTKDKNTKRSFDIAKSDIFMCKYLFRFKGVDMPPKYVYLPFVRDGGVIWLGGSCYHITPVLSDKVISVGFDSIFVRLLRDKLTFKRCYHGYVIDGRRETIHVVWSRIYRNTKNKTPPTTKAMTTALHYLYAKLGFRESMRLLLGFDVIVGEDEINESSYPKSDWVICQSSQLKPKTCIGDFYKATSVRVAVPRHKWNTHVKTVIGGFYYLIDHFPTRLNVSSIDSKDLWIVLLGHIIFSGNYTAGKLHENITEHFNSLEEYVDGIIIDKLREAGHSVSNLYELLALMIRSFNDWIVNNENNITSIYGKNLELDYYVGFEVSSSIFRFVFNANKLATRKELTEKDVQTLLNRNIKPRGVYKLTSGNLAIASVNYSGDNMYPKLTAIINEQESLPGPQRGKHKRKVPDATKRFHTSMLEIGSMLYLPKSNPTPIARMNPYARFDYKTGTIMPSMHVELLERTQRTLDGHMPESIPR